MVHLYGAEPVPGLGQSLGIDARKEYCIISPCSLCNIFPSEKLAQTTTSTAHSWARLDRTKCCQLHALFQTLMVCVVKNPQNQPPQTQN